MRALTTRKRFLGGVTLFALAIGGAACQETPTANVNTNTTVNGNTQVTQTTMNVNAPVAPTEGSVINAREPDKYRATFVLTAQTEGGQQAIAIPQISANVARNGSDRRLEFKLPSGEQIVYLDRADKRYIITPARKQYAELTAESTGFEIQRIMTPGQLVSYLEKQRGYERVGEETLNGRTAEKYRYAATAKTNSQAGDVKSETFVYVDKETGLPLRSELTMAATGDTQNAPKGLRALAEMRDIQTDVDPSLFEVPPAGMTKVEPEQVRQQVDAVGRAVAAIIGSLLNNMNSGGGASTTTVTTTTAASPSPTATVTPR